MGRTGVRKSCLPRHFPHLGVVDGTTPMNSLVVIQRGLHRVFASPATSPSSICSMEPAIVGTTTVTFSSLKSSQMVARFLPIFHRLSVCVHIIPHNPLISVNSAVPVTRRLKHILKQRLYSAPNHSACARLSESFPISPRLKGFIEYYSFNC